MQDTDSDNDSVCGVALGVHSTGKPATEPAPKTPSSHEQACAAVLGHIEGIHRNLKNGALSFEELDSALEASIDAAKRVCRSATLEDEANKSRHAMLIQETQEELSARDVFIARVVERMRASDSCDVDISDRDKSAFLKAVSDANSIQKMMDALLPSHTQLNQSNNKPRVTSIQHTK